MYSDGWRDTDSEGKEIDIPQFVQRRANRPVRRAANMHTGERNMPRRAVRQSDRRPYQKQRIEGQNAHRQLTRSKYKQKAWLGKGKKKIAIAGFLFLLLIFCVIIIGNKIRGRGNSVSSDDVSTFLQNSVKMKNKKITVPEWVVSDILPVNEYSRPGTKLKAVNGIVVHYTGNPNTTAEQNRSYYGHLADTHETKVSSHFVIGMDGTVIQCVPLDEVAYCSNHRNSDTISIECCHADESGQLSRETIDSLLRLLNWLSNTYRLHREDILRHYDVTGKQCPKYYVQRPEEWENLLDKIEFSP